MTAVPVLGRYPLTTAWIVATLAFGTSALGGQEIRFVPIRTALLGSPAGTVGDPVTPEFNADLGCWELQLPAGGGGAEVDLDLQAFGWGNSNCRQPTGLCRVDPGDPCTLPSDCRECDEVGGCLAGTCTDNGATCLESDGTGSGDPCINNTDCTQGTETCRGRLAPCTLGAIQAQLNPAGFSNGNGGDLNPKGWPASPGDGAYQANKRCEFGGDLSPCTGPFDPTCDGFNNGVCVHASNWVMPACANDFPAIATPFLDYAWATAAQVNCNINQGTCSGTGDPGDPCVVGAVPSACPVDETCDSDVKTLGGLILEVPIDAAGTYMIDINRDPNNSFMTSGSGTPIPGVVYTPACITLVCQSDADCNRDDGHSCTTDRCDAGTSTCENIIALNSCLIDDVCYANGQRDPTEGCRLCDIFLSRTDWSDRPAGAACGDRADTDCNHADTCDDAGNCLNNVLPDDTPCPNGNFCDGAELCLSGVCQSADPPCDLEDDLCDEQDDQCDILGDYDGDLLVTQSDFLHWQGCETGPGGGPYAVGCEILDFEQNGFVDLRDYARFQNAFTMP